MSACFQHFEVITEEPTLDERGEDVQLQLPCIAGAKKGSAVDCRPVGRLSRVDDRDE